MPTYETEISEYMWDRFIVKFTTYAKKAKKLKFEEPTYKITKTISSDDNEKNDNPLRNTKIVHCVEITYEMPLIDGWKVIGNRERIDKKIYTKVVTDDNCSKFHTSKSIGCDHCHTNRLRNKSILLKKDTKIIEVGSTCVKDFFGYPITSIDWFCDEVFSNEEWGTKNDDCFVFILKDVIRFTSFYIRKFGYMKSSVDDYNTKERIWDCHVAEKYRNPNYIKPELNEDDETMACKVLDYWGNMDPEEHYHDSYTSNLIKIAQQEYLGPKLLGYAVSMVSTYQNIQDKIELKKNQKPSKHQGNIKDRIKNIPVKLTTKKGWESMYGYTTFMSFMDVDGNVYVTFYKGQKETPERDKNLLLTGTVKEHSEYNNIKQTHINRIIWESV